MPVRGGGDREIGRRSSLHKGARKAACKANARHAATPKKSV